MSAGNLAASHDAPTRTTGGGPVSRPRQSATRRVKSVDEQGREDESAKTSASGDPSFRRFVDALSCLPSGPPRREAKVVACRVDSLYLSFHVELSPDLIAALEKAKGWAQEGHKSFITLAGKPWRVEPKAAGRRHSFLLRNEFAILGVSKIRAKNTPALRFQLLSSFLWEFELEAALSWANDIATAVHTGDGKPRPCLSRADIAVDLAGVDFSKASLDEFVMRPRKKARYRVAGREAESFDRAFAGRGESERDTFGEFFSERELTGYAFGRSAVSARIYDKTREIREQSRDKIWMRTVWARGGWVAQEPVWRVEVQLRREALRELVSRDTGEELDLDDLGRLRESVRSLWRYCTGGVSGHTAWLSWRRPTDAKQPTRWPVRDEWRTAQAAEWRTPQTEELLRFKRRAAAFSRLVPQLVGLMTTMAALKGPDIDGRTSFLSLEEAVTAHLASIGRTWTELVDEKRVELAMWDLTETPWERTFR